MTVAVAKYIGIPFVEHGRDLDGWDCWGLVYCVLRDTFGIDVPSYVDRYSSVYKYDELAALIADARCAWREIARPRPGAPRWFRAARPGDVVLIRLRGRPLHCGLDVGAGNFLHVEEGVQTSIQRYESRRWERRFIGIFRYDPGLA